LIEDAKKLPPGVYVCDKLKEEEEPETIIEEQEEPPSNDHCEPVKSSGECDAISDCTWCKNSAVPPECWLVEDAKKLPPGVYVCDKLEEEEEETQEAHSPIEVVKAFEEQERNSSI